jgi:membrane-associated protein
VLAAGVVANVLTDFTDWIEEVSSNWWFLLIILAVAFFDSIVPIVPSETTVIIGGVAAGAGEQSLPLVILCGAVGAFLGDNTAYSIGHRFSARIEQRGERKPKTKARVDWAKEQIRLRGGLLLITARFIPGGRTVLTLTCGITRQPRAWFAMWVAVAAVIWATYAAGLGYIFGKSFADNHTLAFILAFGAALSVTVLIEVVRHVRSRDEKVEPDGDPSRVGADHRS